MTITQKLALWVDGGGVRIDGTTTLGSVTMTDAKNIALNATTGTKLGTTSSQKLGFWGATPVVQPGHIADATDAATAISQLNLLLADMAEVGLQAAV